MVSRLIYVSTGRHDLQKTDIEDILACANERNSQNDVTGLLLYDGRGFIQMLEGPLDVVDEIFSSIAKDQRHSNISVILTQTDMPRQFGGWSLGYSLINDLRLLDGESWFPLTERTLDMALPDALDPIIRALFASFQTVQAQAAD
ncbi:MAG: hypothetical protein DHS20C06_01050 [Hyphobacterium sp.]|nr:MAG: hypothetical protein DHS20C06_01050 [Hyphobacterium sp.]